MSKEEFKKQKYIKLFIDYINQKNYSVHTLDSYINDLYYFYEFVNIDLINATESDIRNYLEELNKSKEKSSSVRRKISTFKSFYKFLYTNNYMDKKDYPLTRIVYPKAEKRLPKFIYYNDLLEIIHESSLDKDLFWVKSEIYVFFFESLWNWCFMFAINRRD